MSRLTGRTRYRVGWFGRLVLQVEQIRYWQDDHGHVPSKSWRDARAADLLDTSLQPLPFPGRRQPAPGGTMPGGLGHGPGVACLACGDKHPLGVQCPSLRPQAGGRP